MKYRKILFNSIILIWLILALISPFFLSVKASSTTVTLTATDDAYILSNSPDNNYGDESELRFGYNSDLWNYRTYIRFDLSSIPENAVIISAKLKLVDNRDDTSNLNIEVHRVIGDWDESSITWNNQPGYDSVVISSATSGYAGDVIEWDVTDLVQAWVNGTYNNYGFALIGGQTDYYERAYSKEASEPNNRPILVVEYVEPNTVTVTVTETQTTTETETQTITETATQTITETQTTTVANTTITETMTETITQTITETETETQTINQTVTTTQTINNTIYSTVTTTVANTTYYTTIYETISPVYGNQTANYYTDLANQLIPLVMVIGVICSLLGLLLSATGGRR